MEEAEAFLDTLPRDQRRLYAVHYNITPKRSVRLRFVQQMGGSRAADVARDYIAKYGQPTDFDQSAFSAQLTYRTMQYVPLMRDQLKKACRLEAGPRASRSDVDFALSSSTFISHGGGPVLRVCPRQYDNWLRYVRARHAPQITIKIDEQSGTIVWAGTYTWPAQRAEYAMKHGLDLPPMLINRQAPLSTRITREAFVSDTVQRRRGNEAQPNILGSLLGRFIGELIDD